MLIIVLISILIALIFAPLGCIALWKKYLYLGDGLVHASLLAGSISIIFALPIIYSGIIVAIFFASAVFKFKNISGSNAVVSLISSLMLSVALILAIINPSQININQLLFGDIISATQDDLIILLVILGLVYSFVLLFNKQILLIVLNRDIAQTKKMKVKTIELSFLLLLSISVFPTIKIVGSLLVTSILLIPAVSAKLISKTPWQMIILSVIIALVSNLLGLSFSFYLDIPIAPIIIIIESIIYFVFCTLNFRKM